MIDSNILSEEEVLRYGALFDGEHVHWGGLYGQQVCVWTEDGSEQPITGLIYEIRGKHLDYYGYYENGIPNGIQVDFYENGKAKRSKNMSNGILHGSVTCWDTRGRIRFVAEFQYGSVVSFTEWNDNGDLICEQQELISEGKGNLGRHEAIGRWVRGKAL